MKKKILIKDIVSILELRKSDFIRDKVLLVKKKGLLRQALHEADKEEIKSIYKVQLNAYKREVNIIDGYIAELTQLRLFLDAFSREFKRVNVTSSVYFEKYYRYVQNKGKRTKQEQNLLETRGITFSDQVD